MFIDFHAVSSPITDLKFVSAAAIAESGSSECGVKKLDLKPAGLMRILLKRQLHFLCNDFLQSQLDLELFFGDKQPVGSNHTLWRTHERGTDSRGIS